MKYTIENKSNYAGKLDSKKNKSAIPYYSKKQMKSIYPGKEYSVLGEIGNKAGEICGVAENIDGITFDVYKQKSHNPVIESIVGYTQVEGHAYLAVVKNVLIQRMAILLLILALIGGSVAASFSLSSWFKNGTPVNGTLDIDKNAEDSKNQPTGSNGGVSDGIAIPGYKQITLKANQKDQSVSFMNPAQNNCYFVITLLLPDNTEIYKSKMVPPSKGIYQITLNRTLKAGTYEKARIKYECFKMDSNLTPLNGANVEVTLEVK